MKVVIEVSSVSAMTFLGHSWFRYRLCPTRTVTQRAAESYFCALPLVVLEPPWAFGPQY